MRDIRDGVAHVDDGIAYCDTERVFIEKQQLHSVVPSLGPFSPSALPRAHEGESLASGKSGNPPDAAGGRRLTLPVQTTSDVITYHVLGFKGHRTQRGVTASTCPRCSG